MQWPHKIDKATGPCSWRNEAAAFHSGDDASACFGEEQLDQGTNTRTSNYLRTAGEKRGRDAVMAFEAGPGAVRCIERRAAGGRGSGPHHHVFSPEKEFAPFRPNEILRWPTTTRSRINDYIVMGGLTTENYPAAVHEYVHVVIRRSGLKSFR